MANLINIKTNKNLKTSDNIINYLSPDYVYIPYDKKYKLNIKINDEVLKEDILLSSEDKYIYSPISGTITGAKMMLINKENIPSIIIENNYKEKVKKITPAIKNINKITQRDFNASILKYNALDYELKGKTILINGIDLEPYEETYKTIIDKYSTELLETIDAIYDIFKCNKCIFVIKNNDDETIEKLVYRIGTYPNIKLQLMPDLYPISTKNILTNKLNLPKKKLIYLTVEEVLAIYNVLKKKRPITEKIVTISGDAISKPKILNVKIGTTLKDILENNFEIIKNNYKIIINGLLSGYEVDTDEIVITKDTRSIFINTSLNEKETSCINCGLCHTKCPMGCDPRFMINMEKCIKCGTCTYICPSKINFKEKINHE